MTIVSEQIVALFSEENIAPNAYVFSQIIGDGTQTQFIIYHNFNTKKVMVNVFETGGDNEVVMADVEITSLNSVTLFFTNPPNPSQYTVIVIGG